MLKGILWDNDGVLIDTEALYFQATRDVLGSAGVELSRERYVEWSLRQGRSSFDLLQERGLHSGADRGASFSAQSSVFTDARKRTRSDGWNFGRPHLVAREIPHGDSYHFTARAL